MLRALICLLTCSTFLLLLSLLLLLLFGPDWIFGPCARLSFPFGDVNLATASHRRTFNSRPVITRVALASGLTRDNGVAEIIK